MFSQEFIQQVKCETDLVALAGEYTQLKQQGRGIWQGACPHPDHEDSTPSFVVWERKADQEGDSWACMGCHSGKKDSKQKNYGSDAIAFMQWITNYNNSDNKLSWFEAVVYLAERAGIPVEQDKYTSKYEELRKSAIRYHERLPDNVREYLHSRGYDDDDIDVWCVGWDGSRIVFPLPDRYRRIVGFSRRRWGDDKTVPKYINSATSAWFHKGSYLYGIHNIDIDYPYAYVTEGVVDVNMGEKFGVPNVLGTLGTAFTENNADALASLGLIPVFCQDNDHAGIPAIKKSVNMMAARGVASKVCLLPPGMDLADMANQVGEGLKGTLEKLAVHFGYYLINDILSEYDKEIHDIRMKYMPGIMDVINSVPLESERYILMANIYQRFGGDSFENLRQLQQQDYL